MAKKPVSVSLDESLLARIDEKRGELSRSAWIEAEVLKGLAGRVEPQQPPEEPQEPQGRKLDTYPSAPSDPEARSDWTAGRVLGWSGFGRPARVLNADLIAEQQRKAAKG